MKVFNNRSNGRFCMSLGGIGSRIVLNKRRRMIRESLELGT